MTHAFLYEILLFSKVISRLVLCFGKSNKYYCTLCKDIYGNFESGKAIFDKLAMEKFCSFGNFQIDLAE